MTQAQAMAEVRAETEAYVVAFVDFVVLSLKTALDSHYLIGPRMFAPIAGTNNPNQFFAALL